MSTVIFALHKPKLELQPRQGRAATGAGDRVFGDARGAKGAGGHTLGDCTGFGWFSFPLMLETHF